MTIPTEPDAQIAPPPTGYDTRVAPRFYSKTSTITATPTEIAARAEVRVMATYRAEGGLTDNVIAHFALWERMYREAVAAWAR